jgi:hypothetical protein
MKAFTYSLIHVLNFCAIPEFFFNIFSGILNFI